MAYIKLILIAVLFLASTAVQAGNLIATAANPTLAYSPATAVSSQYLHRAIPQYQSIAAAAPVYAKTISTPVTAVHSIPGPPPPPASAVLQHPISISQQSISRSFGGNIYSAGPILAARSSIPHPAYAGTSILPAPIATAYHAPQLISKTYAPALTTYATAPQPIITRTYAAAAAAAPAATAHYAAYSPATVVAHTAFQGLGVEYHY